MSADLEGITVVAVEHAVAASYASGRLVAASARVLKIERPEGDDCVDAGKAIPRLGEPERVRQEYRMRIAGSPA